MPRRYCGSCRSPLHADDVHSECVSCLGKSHADAALAGSDCSHCESISLASLRSRIAFFSESCPAPPLPAPPRPSPPLAERFTETQKASQAMRHFLPKRSSPAAAQSRPRTAPTQQPAKPAPAVSAPQPARTQQPRGRSRSARRHPPPKRQGPRPKIALDPAPPASS